LATLVRTAFVLIFLIALYAFLHGTPKVSTVPRDALLFLALSALTTALSWLFYYRAVQFGPVAAVSAIDKGSLIVTAVLAALFLGETFNLRVLGGAALVSVGLWLMVSARNI
jgi:transporter family protein